MSHLTSASLLAGWLLMGPFSGPAAAVSVQDLVNLKANGLSDEVLVALIETDGSTFNLTPEEVLALHRLGLGERVILAMLRTSSRVQQVSPAPAVAPAPIQQVIVQHVEVPTTAAPVVVHVPLAVGVPVAVPVAWPVVDPRPVRPVYWGFGGTLRPGSWQPAREHDAPPPASNPPRGRP